MALADDMGTEASPGEGRTFAGYTIGEQLGRGGMGVVFAATRDGCSYALKVLLPAASERAAGVTRFLNEARAASRIDHPHVVHVERIDRAEDGRPFLVMERLRGRDLARVLRDDGPLAVERAVDWTLQALAGVAAAHARGIVHRDLKPSNLFCAEEDDGRVAVKVLDFGVSKVIEEGDATETLTGSSTTLGSPAYMSPEQVRSARSVEPRSDVWSVGVILYELLTGVRPFEGDSPGATYAAILERPLTPVRALRPEVPPGLELVVTRCLQRVPELRYRTVATLARALAPFAPRGAEAAERIARTLGAPTEAAEPETATATEPSTPPVGPRGAAPRRRLAFWIGVAGAASLAGAVLARAATTAAALSPAPTTAARPLPASMEGPIASSIGASPTAVAMPSTVAPAPAPPPPPPRPRTLPASPSPPLARARPAEPPPPAAVPSPLVPAPSSDVLRDRL